VRAGSTKSLLSALLSRRDEERDALTLFYPDVIYRYGDGCFVEQRGELLTVRNSSGVTAFAVAEDADAKTLVAFAITTHGGQG
jgi:hypothetical protein